MIEDSIFQYSPDLLQTKQRLIRRLKRVVKEHPLLGGVETLTLLVDIL